MGWGSRDDPYAANRAPYVISPPVRRGLRFSREEYRHILLAVGALTAAFTLGGDVGDYAIAILYFTAYINIFLGGFNMVPIPPLDGSKVLAWNPAIWVLVIAGIAFVFLGFLFPGFLLPYLVG